MWLFSGDGFFSVVKKGEGERSLCVRARVRADLERLVAAYGKKYELGVIEEDAGTDYPYRVYVRPSDFGEMAADMVQRIDYRNFKNHVYSEQGPERAHLYGRIWEVMYDAERRTRRGAAHEVGVRKAARTRQEALLDRHSHSYVKQADGAWEKIGSKPTKT